MYENVYQFTSVFANGIYIVTYNSTPKFSILRKLKKCRKQINYFIHTYTQKYEVLYVLHKSRLTDML